MGGFAIYLWIWAYCATHNPVSSWWFVLLAIITPTEKKNETNILKKIKITKFFGDVNAPLRALYYLTITTFYGCNG
jgi:hypothetical protein